MKKVLGILAAAVIGVSLFASGVCFANYNSDYCLKLPEDIREVNGYKRDCSDISTDPDKVIGDKVTKPINTLLYIVGVLAVVMVVYGGFTYMTSAGDAAKVHKGKMILIYSVVGLIIAILAYAIVNFVITKV